MPAVFLTYIQILFNLTMTTCILYGTLKTYNILQSDLSKHMDKQSQILLSDIVQCSREYIRNGCGQITTPPALEQMCNSWKICMDADINGILTTKESAIVLAEILNNFFNNISDRTIICSTGILVTSVFFTNAVLTYSKRKF